ncbi:uncharacterized protein LOC122373697 isoform X1 [Amphibalanus amphitrite]|uniref:uncharacterized protein LOC122373697 isoform X1 n=1 Tax=Amphibalanus amphitrite TaxID=1232801 RepID=UPI001C905E8E|nr:uncharacterized protein LOC122373697 isoform X1 [Amphibalanus amphitrite]
MPLNLQQPECMIFVADIPCRAAEDVDIAPGCSVAVPYTVPEQPRCSECTISQRHLLFEAQPGLDVSLVPGLACDSQPRVLACNRGRMAVRIRRGEVVGYLATAADASKDLEQPCDVFSVSEEESCDVTLSSTEVPGLTVSQRAAVDDLFQRHAAVFSSSASDPLRTSLTAHRIVLKDDTPVYVPPRRMSPPAAEEIERQCLDLERLGIIERCDSAWSAPVVPVRKKDGSLRLCIDYRRLNKQTVATRFPMADVTDSVYSAHGMKFFTTLDLAKGYYQVPLEESSKDYTAFSTARQHWRFRRLPFGLKNAPAAFQREMQTVLQGFSRRNLVIYLDDLLLMEKNFEKHLQLVDDVLLALESQGIKLNAKKCVWFQPEVPFLGHVISERGLRRSPEYIKKVRSLPRPQTVKQLRQFLGVINFQRKFVRHCSSISKPLTDLTGQPGPTVITWTDQMTDAFEKLKQVMEEEVTLAFPDYTEDAQPLTLWTDASQVGAGACLTQEQDGETRHIGFASMTFSRSQQNYSVTELELAALRWGVVKAFKPFLGGVSFRVCTDHQALVYMHSMHLVNSRIARTMEELSEFDFTICYVPGSSNIAADMFSRAHPLPMELPAVCRQLPVGLDLYYRAEGGGDALIDCLCHWMEENDRRPAQNHLLRELLVGEVMKAPGRFKMKLDRRARQTLKSMKVPGQPLSVEMVAVFATLMRVRVIVHFGGHHPMIFTGPDGEEVAGQALHLQCLGGVHFNLLKENKNFQTQNTVLVAHIQEQVRSQMMCRVKLPERVTMCATEEGGSPEDGLLVHPLCDHQSSASCAATVYVNDRPVCALLDSGAAVSMVSRAALELIGTREADVIPSAVSVRGIGGLTNCTGYLEADVALPGDGDPQTVRLLIDSDNSFGHCVLLGANFLTSACVELDFGRRLISSVYGEHAMSGHCAFKNTATGLTLVTSSQECSDAEDVLLPDSRERIPDIASVREHQHQDRLLHELTSHVRQKLTEQELPRELEHFDHFSKWAVAVPVRRKTSAAVAVALEQRVLPVLLRRPARLLTDNGGEFVGPELQEVLRRWGIQQTFSTPYRPQGNGAVERLNRTLSQELRMLSADKPGDWDLHLPKAMATYNGTSHSQLGDSPADFLLKQKHGGVSVPLVSVERQSCWRPGNPSFAPFEVGQLVKRETQRPGNLLTGKFEQRFDGPFKVKSRNSNDVTYTLERDTGAELRAHHTQLRPWITAPSYLRRLEEVREDGEGRGCSMHPPLPAGGVLTSVGSAGERRLPGILKNTRRAQDRSQQTTPPRVSSSAQQTTPPPRVSSSAQQTTPPPKNDGAQLAVSRPPASAPQQRTRATSAAKRTVRFDDVGREIPRRSGRVREAPDRWGYS